MSRAVRRTAETTPSCSDLIIARMAARANESWRVSIAIFMRVLAVVGLVLILLLLLILPLLIPMDFSIASMRRSRSSCLCCALPPSNAKAALISRISLELAASASSDSSGGRSGALDDAGDEGAEDVECRLCRTACTVSLLT